MRTIPISDYDYILPDNRIAKYPLPQRDLSKLLVYKNAKIEESNFASIDNYLPSGSLLIFNDTKVIQARLKFKKATGAEIEIFCLEPHKPADYYQAFQVKKTCLWKCLVGNSKKWKEGKIELVSNNGYKVDAERVSETSEYSVIRFSWVYSDLSFGQILEHEGNTPIPPYLHRKSEELDRTRYQTIYSNQDG